MKKVITAAILAVIAPRWTTSTASDTAPPGLYRSIVYDIYAALDLARNPAIANSRETAGGGGDIAHRNCAKTGGKMQ